MLERFLVFHLQSAAHTQSTSTQGSHGGGPGEAPTRGGCPRWHGRRAASVRAAAAWSHGNKGRVGHATR
jgi:hypothetical protein